MKQTAPSLSGTFSQCPIPPPSLSPQKAPNPEAKQELQRLRVLHYSSPPLFFFFLLLVGACPASFRRCTTRRVHDSSLSHSKPARYWRSSSSSACACHVSVALGLWWLAEIKTLTLFLNCL